MELATAQRHFSYKLRRSREMAGFSQNRVAAKMKQKSSANISRWEAGLAMPSVINLCWMCKIYGVSPNEFLEEYLLLTMFSEMETETTSMT